MNDHPAPQRRMPATMVVAMIASVFGAKLMLINAFGSSVPFWDQWDSEAFLLYKPYLEGHLDPASLVSLHNEHRIFFTKILAILQLEANGLWDPRLQTVSNAVLHVGVIAMFANLVSRSMSEAHRFVVCALTAFLYSLPFGWENTLAGFQSQFYFVFGFSIAGLALVAPAEAFTRRWLFGWLALAAAFFGMASGALAPAAAVAMSMLQLLSGARKPSLREGLGVVVLIATFLVMYSAIPDIAHHASLKAQNLDELIGAMMVVASWPSRSNIVVAVLQNLPVLVFVCATLWRKQRLESTDWFIVGAMAWVALQWLSFAYGRADGPTASRYADTLTAGLLINVAAALHLGVRRPLPRLSAAAYCMAIFSIAAVAGHAALTTAVPERKAAYDLQLANLRSYMASGDLERLRAAPFFTIPYPDADRLAMIAGDPAVCSILHPDITGLALTDRLSLPSGVTWFFRAGQLVLLIIGPAIFALGILLFVFSASKFLLARRRKAENGETRAG